MHLYLMYPDYGQRIIYICAVFESGMFSYIMHNKLIYMTILKQQN